MLQRTVCHAVDSIVKQLSLLSAALTAVQDASAKAAAIAAGAAEAGTFLQVKDGRFVDDRWVGGRWDLSMFAKANGETDWDAVSAWGL